MALTRRTCRGSSVREALLRLPIDRYDNPSGGLLQFDSGSRPSSWVPESVLRHLGVDDLGPELDAAGETPHLPESQIPEHEAAVHAAVADVAIDDRPLLAIQLLDARRQLGERDVDGALDVGLLPLPVLADVEHDDLFPGVHHLVHDLGRNLEFLKVVSHRCVTVLRCVKRPARARSEKRYPVQISAASAYAATA